METMTATASMPFPREPANYDEVSMQQSMLFSDSLKVLCSIFHIIICLVVLCAYFISFKAHLNHYLNIFTLNKLAIVTALATKGEGKK